jgi:hypothetical protein
LLINRYPECHVQDTPDTGAGLTFSGIEVPGTGATGSFYEHEIWTNKIFFFNCFLQIIFVNFDTGTLIL